MRRNRGAPTPLRSWEPHIPRCRYTEHPKNRIWESVAHVSESDPSLRWSCRLRLVNDRVTFGVGAQSLRFRTVRDRFRLGEPRSAQPGCGTPRSVAWAAVTRPANACRDSSTHVHGPKGDAPSVVAAGKVA